MAAKYPYEFLQKLRLRNLLARQMLGEFLASFILVLVCDLVEASYGLIPGRTNPEYDLLGVCVAAGVGLYVALMVGAAHKMGHAAPFVTLSLATVNKFPWSRVPFILLVHYLGALVASAVTWLNYYEAIYAYDKGELIADYGPNKTGTGFIFASFPAEYTTAGGAFIDQMICVALFMFIIMLAIDGRHPYFAKRAAIPIISVALIAIVVCFESNAEAAINPARDLMGRVFTTFVGYGSKAFDPINGHHWWLGGQLGPYVGGILGAWIYVLVVEIHHDDGDDDDDNNEYCVNKQSPNTNI